MTVQVLPGVVILRFPTGPQGPQGPQGPAGSGGGGGVPYQDTPLGFGNLTVTGAVTLFSTILVNGVAGIPAETTYAIVIVESADVRWRNDGVDPAPGPGGGMPLLAGEVWQFAASEMDGLKFIAQESVSAILSVSFSQ